MPGTTRGVRARLILEHGIRTDLVETNPRDSLEKLTIDKERRYVTDEELALALEVGRAAGKTRLVVAQALRTAWLCVRRSVEVRALTRDAIRESGTPS